MSKRKKNPIKYLAASKKLKTEPPVGSLGLIKVGDAKAKFGLVNISSKKVDEALAEVGSVPFYPVKLGSTHLQKHLFYTEKSFTDIKQGDIQVLVHLDQRLPLCGLIKPLSNEALRDVTRSLRALMLASFPTDLEVTQPSLICTKELKDREVVGQAILQMMPGENLVIYSNEARVCVSGNKKFVNGDLDLLFGEKSQYFNSSHIYVKVADKDEEICNPEISETKSEDGRLAATRLSKENPNSVVMDLASTLQPILQLLIIGQLSKGGTREHINCFFMNRYKVRPYIYFPSHDVMIATRRSYVWRTDDRLMLRGSLLIALLLRFNDLSKIPSQLWMDKFIPRTTFCKTSKEAKVNFLEHYYISSPFKTTKKDTLISDSKAEVTDLSENTPNVPSYISLTKLSSS